MHVVYILQSEPHGRFYVGSTKDMDARLRLHNAGRVQSTKFYRPWKVVYTEQAADNLAARHRELELKRFRSHARLARLIEAAGAQSPATGA